MSESLAIDGGRKTIAVDQRHYTWPVISPELLADLTQQASRSLSDKDGGGITSEFERQFALFSQRRFAVAFSSGTGAIHAMCIASGLTEGVEILCCAYGFFATVSPFAYEGIVPVFCDSDGYGNPSIESLRQRKTPRTKAVIVCHMWGNPCDMGEITAFCKAHNLLLLEDCSHAHFASWKGQAVGTFGHMAAFSLNQKAITAGEGGVFTTDEEQYRDFALLLGHYNGRCKTEMRKDQSYYKYWRTGMGLKYRPHPLSMAIGLNQLRHRHEIEERRRANLKRLAASALREGVLRPLVIRPEDGLHGLYVMAFQVTEKFAPVGRDVIQKCLWAEGATEFDIPGSTRLMVDEPLFRRSARDQSWSSSVDHFADGDKEPFPMASHFDQSIMKLPLWGYEGDERIVSLYCEAIEKVCSVVSKDGARLQKSH